MNSEIELLDIDAKLVPVQLISKLIGPDATEVLTAKNFKNGVAKFECNIFVDESKAGIPVVGFYRLL